MIGTETIAETAHEIVWRGFKHEFGVPREHVREQPQWDKIRRLGTKLWLDTGDADVAAKLWCSEFEALTTNNTLLNKEIQKGIYDRLIGASMRDSSQVAGLAGVDVYTMPPKVADEYLQNPADEIVEQVTSDPSVCFADGVTSADFNAPTLWEASDEFKQCVDELARENVGRMTAGDVREYFADHGFADFLPQWSEEDIRTALADGKIPVYSRWKERLANGEIGMDALMNVSAFYSFASDQEALDAHIESLI